MKEPYEKGLAIRSAPSFALGAVKFPVKRKQGERWAGYRAAFATPAWPPLIIQFGPPDCQFPAFAAGLLWGALAGVKPGFARRADPGETEAGAPQSAGYSTVSSADPPSFS